MNTCWAILFLTKSTAKTLRRIQIQRLGAGTLLGGRGLPKDLTSMTVAGGRVVSRPMNGAIEGMLAVLEDPRAEQADAAAAGLVDRYYREGPDALRPYKPRFRKMLADRDPGVRRVAAWALAHTGDMDIVPALIDALDRPRRGRGRRLAAGPPGHQPQDRGPGAAQSVHARTAQASRRPLARLVQRHQAAGPRRRRQRTRPAARAKRRSPASPSAGAGRPRPIREPEAMSPDQGGDGRSRRRPALPAAPRPPRRPRSAASRPTIGSRRS